MSKILLVEPRPILRQALSVALFPEHDLQLAASVSVIDESAAEFDLIILDSAALRQTGKTGGALLQKLQDWRIPAIWIEDAGAGPGLPRGRIVVLKTPIEKDALRSAIASCLDGSLANHKPTASKLAKGRPTRKAARTVGDSPATAPQIIELVDVVAEPPERVEDKTAKIRTK